MLVVKMALMPQGASGRPLPHVSVATWAENRLQDKDGTFSLIRIVDTMLYEGDLEGAGSLPLKGLIILKSDKAVGDYSMRLEILSPRGRIIRTKPMVIKLTGAEQGTSAPLDIPMKPDGPGLYWTSVIVDDVVLTRIPLRLAPVQQPRSEADSQTAPPRTE